MTDEPKSAITPIDLTKTVVMSGASAIAAFTGDPGLQGATAMGVGFFGLASKYMFSKLEKWRRSLDSGFVELVKAGFDFDSLDEKEKDRILTIVSKATFIAMQDLREEKRQYLYNAVINSVHDKSDSNLQLMFVHYVEVLNSWHIQMLKAFDRPREQQLANLIDWRDLDSLEAELPSIPKTVSRQILDALVTNGLVYQSRGGNEYPGNESSHITELGKQFLRYISTPPSETRP